MSEKRTKPDSKHCLDCNVELSWREMATCNHRCYICERLRCEREGVIMPDTVQYDDRDFE